MLPLKINAKFYFTKQMENALVPFFLRELLWDKADKHTKTETDRHETEMLKQKDFSSPTECNVNVV